jgi:hypothetical protein
MARRQYRAQNREVVACKHCDTPFMPHTRNQKYCTHECAAATKKQIKRKYDQERYARKREEYRQRGREYYRANRELIRKRGREYYSNNKDAISESTRKYQQRNKERIAKYQREYRRKNLNHILESHRNHYLANKEKYRQSRRRWRAENPDKVGKLQAMRARAELEGNAKPELIEAKWEASDKTCCLCGDPIDNTLPPRHPMSRTLEHLIPIVRGGRHDMDNIAFAHYSCNASKKDKTLEEHKAWLAAQSERS